MLSVKDQCEIHSYLQAIIINLTKEYSIIKTIKVFGYFLIIDIIIRICWKLVRIF